MRNTLRSTLAGGLALILGATGCATRVNVSDVDSGRNYSAKSSAYEVPILSPLIAKDGKQTRQNYFVKAMPAGTTAMVGDTILPRTSTMGVYLCELANSEFNQANGSVNVTGNGTFYFPVNVAPLSAGVSTVNTGSVATARVTIADSTNTLKPYMAQTGKNSSVMSISPSRENIGTVSLNDSENYLVLSTTDRVYNGTNTLSATDFMLMRPTEGTQRITRFDAKGNATETLFIRGNVMRPVEGKLVKIPEVPKTTITNAPVQQKIITGSINIDDIPVFQ